MYQPTHTAGLAHFRCEVEVACAYAELLALTFHEADLGPR